mgnify:CR=1 FL=1
MRTILAPCLTLLAAPLFAAPVVPAAALAGHDLSPLGKVRPRAASEIASSTWSIGGETLDRDFAVYDHYKPFLGPLGAKAIRLQAGWAKCERSPGVYTFEWLDAVIDDARAQGVQPWVEFNYGNPIYPGGGDTGLGGGFPSSPEALAAWDRWVAAVVERYRDRVHQWEVWNEPDINRAGTAGVEAYVDLFVRTATIVRARQPQSQIWALGLAGDIDYADRFLAGLKEKGRLDLVDAVTIHGYPRNPDDTNNIDRLRAVIAKYSDKIHVRQGETGSNSKYQEGFALSRISWTENLQAKWNLRRMLAHRALEVPFNLFTLCDLHYTQATVNLRAADGTVRPEGSHGELRVNHKGLLGTNPDMTISHVKPSYTAAQSVFALFDDRVSLRKDFPFSTTALRAVALAGYALPDGAQMVAYWFKDAPPSEGNEVTKARLVLPQARFEEPVLVDLRTSTVYALPKSGWTQDAAGATFHHLPFYDSPLLIAERRAVPLAPAAR